jgi:hypothetical protein
MNEQHADTIQQITGQVRALFYFVDEPITTLTIQLDGQTITARAIGQLALHLRALPRRAARRSVRRSTMPRPTIRRSSPSPSSPPDRAFPWAEFSNGDSPHPGSPKGALSCRRALFSWPSPI